jgi:hypothetical protein
MKFTLRKKVAAVVAVAGLVGAGTAAFAFFSANGSGSGNASVGSSTPWTVSVSNDTSNALLPGSGSETLNYTVTNGNAGNQAINTLSAVVGNSGTGGACLGSWFTATVNAPTPVIGTSIAPGNSATGTITVTMQNTPGTAQDACQGLTSVPVTLNVT